eukprot:gene6155-4434_t
MVQQYIQNSTPSVMEKKKNISTTQKTKHNSIDHGNEKKASSRGTTQVSPATTDREDGSTTLDAFK